MSPGQTLRLAAGGTYTLGAGVNGFSTLPSGSAGSVITIEGNGATITGGAVGVYLSSKNYIDIKNLRVGDQSTAAIQLSSCTNLNLTGCTFYLNSTQSSYIDVAKMFDISDCTFADCDAYLGASASSPTDTLDLWEIWPTVGIKSNVTFTRCRGWYEIDTTGTNRHAFEVYRDTSGRYYTGVSFADCQAWDAAIGFSVESGGIAATSHTVTASGCRTWDNKQYDYANDSTFASFTVSTPKGENGESISPNVSANVTVI